MSETSRWEISQLDERISRMEAKIDLMLPTLIRLETKMTTIEAGGGLVGKAILGIVVAIISSALTALLATGRLP